MKLFSKLSVGLLVITLILSGLTISISGQAPLRIMALGNSLTVGENGEPNPALQLPPDQLIGYRYGLKYLLQSGGYNVDFVGSQSNGSAFFSDYQHAGIGGSRDQYVERLLIDGYDQRNGEQILSPPRFYLDVYNPDIILLHVGTNDVTHENDLIANQRVSAILDLIDQYEVRSGKVVTVFLALIINRRLPCVAGSGCQTTKDWNEFLRNMAEARKAAGDKIVIVDMEHDAGIVYTDEDFYAADPEGLHLNSNGYGKMAACWYNHIINNVNTPPQLDPIPDQSIGEHDSFDVIQLDNYVYDIEDADTDLSWTTTHLTSSNLHVAIDANRQATISLVTPGWTGTESILFKVTDNGVNGSFAKSASDTVSFSIGAENDLPVITGQSDLSVIEDGSITLEISDFTVYDPDPDQSPEDQILNVLSGDHYTVTGNTVNPESDYDTDIHVNVSVSDVIGPGPVYQALIHVNAVNDPPLYLGHTNFSFNEDKSYTVTFNDIDVSDSDHSESELRIIMKPGNNHSINGPVITPDPNYFGNLIIETYVEDPLGARSVTFNLQVEIKPINDLPAFTTDPEDTAVVNEPYIYPFNAEDADGDGGTLSFIILEKPSWMTYFPNSKLLAGTPASEHIGYAHVHIRATDGLINVDQTFYVHVLMGTTAAQEITLEGQPYLYPNPSSGNFYIQYQNQKSPGVFRLFDNLGRIKVQEQLIPGEIISLSSAQLNLLHGIYHYTIQSGSEYYTGKLILNSQY